MTTRRLPLKAQNDTDYYDTLLDLYEWVNYFVDVLYWFVFYFLDRSNFWAGLFRI